MICEISYILHRFVTVMKLHHAGFIVMSGLWELIHHILLDGTKNLKHMNVFTGKYYFFSISCNERCQEKEIKPSPAISTIKKEIQLV